MKNRILSAKIVGFKNIDVPLELQFANKTIDKSFFKKPSIKAIYGTNGSGKSALAHALNIYRNTITDFKFLPIESYSNGLHGIINGKQKKACVDLYFASLLDDEKIAIFHHIVEYEVADKEIFVLSEKLLYCKSKTWGNIENESLIFYVEKGEIKNLPKLSEDYKNAIIEGSKNLLRSSSLAARWPTTKFDGEVNKIDVACESMMIIVFYFAYTLNVFLDEKDTNIVNKAMIREIVEKSKDKNLSINDHIVIDSETDEISDSQLNQYEEELKQITKFLKVFKPNLTEITFDKVQIDPHTYRCNKILLYDNGDKVDARFESNGIKKMMKLYPMLNRVDKGGIAFIDEFDSNIHDVYLCKLIEYFSSFSSGQLIFTTHNLGPMEVLADTSLKHAIDFINQSTISSWVKNGNYSIVNVYRSGAIPNSPFNINSSDFAKTFGD